MMQNWEAMQPNAHFDQHNSWYNSMFAAQIKTEPGTTPPPSSVSQGQTAVNAAARTSHLEHYLNMKQHQQQQQQQQQQHQHSAMDTMSAMTPSPSNNDSLQHHFYDNNMQQQLMQHQQQQQQQQQYQQQFQAAQQAAAQHNQSTQMPLGFNPLTPPGLPSAVLPPMPHFYANHSQIRSTQQTPSPQPVSQLHMNNTPLDSVEKMSTALTPRNTPPMDVTPPKSPKSLSGLPTQQEQEKEQDLMSNSSEDMKYMAESEDDESIRMPIYNSHGKMKNYKCKTCGLVAITKIAFWEHARSHMKPEKILQCPKCPFVTELKHHLEYHIRKHKNLKPFQCDKCSYSCVNKSMLNSHRKSHSSVYQYRCADCDYATKYCHSFKLHLRKYDHKPGMVLDEEGIPNPSVVIDVYGTRRGPKNKSGSSSNSGGASKRAHSNTHHAQERLTSANLNSKTNNSSQLSAALQGFPMPQHQMPASPAKSCSSTTSELPIQAPKKQQSAAQNTQQQMPNLLSTIMQQNHNMAFFPYWNLNLQMLAAQQQAAVLAQLSPRMRETAIQQLQGQQQDNDANPSDEDDDNADEEGDVEFDRKSVDSAMDLSQGTPIKEEEEQQQQTPAVAMNLKVPEEVLNTNETPLMSTVSNTSRRKGRVLKLETLLQTKAASLSPEQPKISVTGNSTQAQNSDAPSSADESMETTTAAPAATSTPPAANTSASSTASSSGNSSNSSSTSSSGNPNGAIYECKYCDIYFKDAVLYTIHMGYHSCDDVFKCNMCGEKCDGPVGLFVHMARNAHS